MGPPQPYCARGYQPDLEHGRGIRKEGQEDICFTVHMETT